MADEFSAMGGMPIVPGAGRDRSGERAAIRELSWAQFDALAQSLASAAKAFRPDVVVGLVHGGVFVGGALASALQADFYPVRVTRRSRDPQGDAAVAHDLPEALAGRRVLLVDDVAASGDSLEFALLAAKARRVRHVATAALVRRPGRYRPDYFSLESDELFVFPWDYAPLVRDGRFEPEALQPVAPRGRRPRSTPKK